MWVIYVHCTISNFACVLENDYNCSGIKSVSLISFTLRKILPCPSLLGRQSHHAGALLHLGLSWHRQPRCQRRVLKNFYQHSIFLWKCRMLLCYHLWSKILCHWECSSLCVSQQWSTKTWIQLMASNYLLSMLDMKLYLHWNHIRTWAGFWHSKSTHVFS